jgi:hypothetical protein
MNVKFSSLQILVLWRAQVRCYSALPVYFSSSVLAFFWAIFKYLREGDHLGDLGVDGIILKWIFKKWDGGMEWIELAQDRDRWRTLVNAVMNLRVP